MAQLVLNDEEVTIAGRVDVFGTQSGQEIVDIVGGDITLDASFNSGGDLVHLLGDAIYWSARRSGSTVELVNGSTHLTAPVGRDGMDVAFGNVLLSLRYDTVSGQVMIGDHVIGSAFESIIDTPTPVDTTPPQLVSFTSPDIDLANGIFDSGFAAQATDASGIDHISFDIRPAAASDPESSVTVILSGSQLDGGTTLTTEITVNDVLPGDFVIEGITVEDNAGNASAYTGEALDALGFDRELHIDTPNDGLFSGNFISTESHAQAAADAALAMAHLAVFHHTAEPITMDVAL